MTYLAVRLAVATGIPPGVWIDEGDRVMQTACLVFDEQDREAKSSSRGRRQGGPQMSG